MPLRSLQVPPRTVPQPATEDQRRHYEHQNCPVVLGPLDAHDVLGYWFLLAITRQGYGLVPPGAGDGQAERGQVELSCPEGNVLSRLDLLMWQFAQQAAEKESASHCNECASWLPPTVGSDVLAFRRDEAKCKFEIGRAH